MPKTLAPFKLLCAILGVKKNSFDSTKYDITGKRKFRHVWKGVLESINQYSAITTC